SGLFFPTLFFLPGALGVLGVSVFRQAWKRRVSAYRAKPLLGLLGGEEVQTLVKFVKLPSPHPPPLSQWERVAEGRVRGPWPIEPYSSAVRLLASSRFVNTRRTIPPRANAELDLITFQHYL